MGFLLRRKRDSLCASQQGILSKHRNRNSFKEFCLFYFPKKLKQVWFLKIKNPQQTLWVSFCGERGIRTPGPVTVNSFQDCRIRPLCHFSGRANQITDSGCKYRKAFHFVKAFVLFLMDYF